MIGAVPGCTIGTEPGNGGGTLPTCAKAGDTTAAAERTTRQTAFISVTSQFDGVMQPAATLIRI
jgi:hypothetical protein